MSLLTQERIEDALPPKGPGFGDMAQRNTEQITDNSHFLVVYGHEKVQNTG